MTLKPSYQELFPGLCALGTRADGWVRKGKFQKARRVYLRLLLETAQRRTVDRFLAGKIALGVLVCDALEQPDSARRLLSGEALEPFGSLLAPGLKTLEDDILSDSDCQVYAQVKRGTLAHPPELSPWDVERTRRGFFETLVLTGDGPVTDFIHRAQPGWKRLFKSGKGVEPTPESELPELPEPVHTAQELACLHHPGSVERLEFSRDGGYLASWSDAGTVRLWAGTEQVAELDGARHQLVGFSPDGSRLYVTREGTLEIRRLPDLQVERKLAGITGGVLSPKGRVVAGFRPGAFPVLAGPRLMTIETRDVTDLRDGEGCYRSQHCLAFSPDGTRLAETMGSRVLVWNLASNQVELTTEDLRRDATGVRFTPDGTRLVITTMGGSLFVFHLEQQAFLNQVLTHAEIRSLSIDQEIALVGCADRESYALAFHLSSGGLFGRLECGRDTWSVALFPDGQHLASGHEDGTVRLWRWGPAQFY